MLYELVCQKTRTIPRLLYSIRLPSDVGVCRLLELVAKASKQACGHQVSMVQLHYVTDVCGRERFWNSICVWKI